MAHLSEYQGKELYDICDFMGVAVSGTKAEQAARLKGKFTAEMARIFESYGGFERKPGDATVRSPIPNVLLVWLLGARGERHGTVESTVQWRLR